MFSENSNDFEDQSIFYTRNSVLEHKKRINIILKLKLTHTPLQSKSKINYILFLILREAMNVLILQ